MKVLHLLNTDRFSGAENVACQIVSMLDGKDFDFVYCSRDGSIRDELQKRKIPFAPVKELSIKEVKRVIREQKPAVIHAHDMRASFVAALACGKIPLISHIHNNGFDSRHLNLKSILYYYAARKSQHIFWVSNSAFAGYVLHKSLENKSSVLVNVIDISALYQKMEQDDQLYTYDIVYIGRLSMPKNPSRLVGVLEKVLEKSPNSCAALVGTGELEQEVSQLINKKKLQSRIKMLGFQENPLKILHDSKVMIMTSFFEGTPMCALEAMALGVPIVSTPTDGMCQVVDDGVTGYLSDDDNVLAEKCLELITDENLQKKMSESSLARAKELMDVDSYSKTIKKEYQKNFHRKV